MLTHPSTQASKGASPDFKDTFQPGKQTYSRMVQSRAGEGCDLETVGVGEEENQEAVWGGQEGHIWCPGLRFPIPAIGGDQMLPLPKGGY